MSDRIYFPDIRAPGWPFVEQHEDTSLRTKFEDGSMQTRSKFTRSRRKWTLHWNNLPRRQYLVLVHFITVGEWKNEAMRYWSGDIELTEV